MAALKIGFDSTKHPDEKVIVFDDTKDKLVLYESTVGREEERLLSGEGFTKEGLKKLPLRHCAGCGANGDGYRWCM